MVSGSQKPDYRTKDPFDNAVYSNLFNELYTPLCRFAMRFTLDKDIAEDIVQDLFLYLWENWERFSAFPSIKSYAFTAVKNKSLNHLKKQYLREKTNDLLLLQEIGEDHKLPNPQQLIEYKELELILEKAMESLPDKCRTIFAMKRFGELSNKEIAEHLKISIKTVEAQTTIAIRKLTNFVSSHWDLTLLIILNYLNLFF